MLNTDDILKFRNCLTYYLTQCLTGFLFICFLSLYFIVLSYFIQVNQYDMNNISNVQYHHSVQMHTNNMDRKIINTFLFRRFSGKFGVSRWDHFWRPCVIDLLGTATPAKKGLNTILRIFSYLIPQTIQLIQLDFFRVKFRNKISLNV